MIKFVFAFATLALAIASAANRYNVKLYVPSEVGGQIVKPGEYTLELKDNRAVLKGDRGTVAAEARVETQDKKFSSTSVRYTSDQPNAKIDEIRIGGTTTKFVFAKPQASGN